ncbi:ACT domain-containing protein, partial [candidate division NPL-UPA2 bacterium]|nr:ACT domain-containing protein [candidate division NPL-UPA2 bacterium]
FKTIADRGINIDMIIQNIGEKGKSDISFTVIKGDLKKTLAITRKVAKIIGANRVDYDENIARVSIVGVGMRTHSGVAARMFGALASKKINIEMISTSEIKISCVVDKKHGPKAVRAIHAKFELGKR